MQIIVTLLQME